MWYVKNRSTISGSSCKSPQGIHIMLAVAAMSSYSLLPWHTIGNWHFSNGATTIRKKSIYHQDNRKPIFLTVPRQGITVRGRATGKFANVWRLTVRNDFPNGVPRTRQLKFVRSVNLSLSWKKIGKMKNHRRRNLLHNGVALREKRGYFLSMHLPSKKIYVPYQFLYFPDIFLPSKELLLSHRV